MVLVTDDGKAIDDSDANPQHVLGRFLTSHNNKQREQVREMDPIPVRVITAQGW